MSFRRLLSLFLILLVVGMVCYVFYLNSSPIEVYYSNHNKWQASSALVLIITFSIGVILTSALSFVFWTFQTLKIRKLRKELQRKDDQRNFILLGREHFAIGEFAEASKYFSKALAAEPQDSLARVLLCESEMAIGDKQSALSVIDNMRQEDKDNVELLYIAGNVYHKQGNYLAAFDGFSLALKLRPKNIGLLKQLVDSAIHLHRLDEAISLQKRLIKLLSGDDKIQALDFLAELELKFINIHNKSSAELEKALKNLLIAHKDFPPALAQLAVLKKQGDHPKEAVNLLSKAFIRSGDGKFLLEIANIWIRRDRPLEAIAAIKSNLAKIPANIQLNAAAKLALAEVYLVLEMIKEAKQQMDSLNGSLQSAITSGDKEFQTKFIALKTSLNQRAGKTEEALQDLIDYLSNIDKDFVSKLLKQKKYINGDTGMKRQPSPQLSTP